jgi:glucan phosphoethanolaminetransferase (alkaline phosphatase superfamily)
MDNFYYYFFYVISIFAKTINKKNKDYLGSAFFFVSLCIGLNILTLLFLIELKFKISATSKFFAILAEVIVLIFNYGILLKEGKGQKIFEHFDKKYKDNKKQFWKKFLALLYVLLTFGICIYIRTLLRATYRR